MVLGKTKEIARAYLGHKVTHAVITVPCCENYLSTISSIDNLSRFQRRRRRSPSKSQRGRANSGATRIAKVQQLLKQYFQVLTAQMRCEQSTESMATMEAKHLNGFSSRVTSSTLAVPLGSAHDTRDKVSAWSKMILDKCLACLAHNPSHAVQ